MAKNYDQLSKDIIMYVGGSENVLSLVHCATRLRFKIKNYDMVNKNSLSQLSGVITVVESGGQLQIVIGTHVADVYEAILKNTNLKEGAIETGNEKEKKSVLNVFMETISGIFAPTLMAMTGAGMLKALLVLATTLHVLTTDMGTYRILYAAADGLFTFLPLVLAVTTARKFKANEFVALAIAAALVYPDITAAYSAGEQLTFLKIPVVLVSYTSSVIPIIITVYVLSKLEKLLNKILPDVIKQIFVPMLSLIFMVPLTYLIIGPVFDGVGKAISAAYTGLVGINPVIAGGILGLIWPAAVLFGVHWGFTPIVVNNYMTYGYDTLFVITGPNNMAQAGAALGVFLKSKNKEVRETAGPAALSAVLAGITEPAIYGVNLKYKKPFFIGAVFSGIAGAIVAAAGTRTTAVVGTSLLSLPAYIGVGFAGFLIACAIAYFGSAIVTYCFGYSDDVLPKESEEVRQNDVEKVKDSVILAPVSGVVIPLEEIKDEVFSSGSMGAGVAIIPDEGKICAPCDGILNVVYPTGHAYGITTEEGAELLIHIGMDTVSLDGKCFSVKVHQGQTVRAGDVLAEVDLEGIKNAGLETATPIIVTNADEFKEIKVLNMGKIQCGKEILCCLKG